MREGGLFKNLYKKDLLRKYVLHISGPYKSSRFLRHIEINFGLGQTKIVYWNQLTVIPHDVDTSVINECPPSVSFQSHNDSSPDDTPG